MKKFKVEYINSYTLLFDDEYLKEETDDDNGNRLIFMNQNYVIKCDNWNNSPYNIGYWKQCYKEFRNYHTFKNTQYSKNFVPVLQSGKINEHRYVVQPRVDIIDIFCDIDYESREKLRNKAKEISNYFNLCDIYEYNYTVFNNDILIFDYAY